MAPPLSGQEPRHREVSDLPQVTQVREGQDGDWNAMSLPSH